MVARTSCGNTHGSTVLLLVAHFALGTPAHTVHTGTDLSPSYVLSLGALDDVRLQQTGALVAWNKTVDDAGQARGTQGAAMARASTCASTAAGRWLASPVPSFTPSSLPASQAPCTRAHTQDRRRCKHDARIYIGPPPAARRAEAAPPGGRLAALTTRVTASPASTGPSPRLGAAAAEGLRERGLKAANELSNSDLR